MTTPHLVHSFWSRVSDQRTNVAMLVSYPTVAGLEPHTGRITWGAAGVAVVSIMNLLREHGVRKGDRVAILGWNCPEWVWTDLALQSIGAIAVPIYPNLSASQVEDIINDSGAKLAVTADPEQCKKLLGKGGGSAVIPAVILRSEIGEPFFLHFVGSGGNEVLTDSREVNALFAQIIEHVRYHRMVYISSRPNTKVRLGFLGLYDDDIASIIYTSGSTGVPKGCMISHGNIAAEMKSLYQTPGLARSTADQYLSYLPMAHVYERFNGMAFAIWNGVPAAFCAVDEVKKGLTRYQPTMLCGVPAVWRKIKESVENPEDQPLKRLDSWGLWKPLLKWAFSRKAGSFQHKVADRLIYSKIRAKLGGKLDLIVSGGAPINPEVLAFFNKVGLVLMEGYGLSETTGGIAINCPDASGNCLPGSVGKVIPGCEVRIVFEDGETEFGEIQLRGKQIFKGYWKKPAETAAVFTDDGWFRTGDNGRLDSAGNLFVIGRKNGLYKTEGGKFVAKEKLEKEFEGFSIIQCVVPVAHGRKFTTALVFVNQVNARKLIGRAVPAGADAPAYLAEQKEVLAAVEAAVEAANKKLARWEQVKKYRIIPVEAQVNNGLLTPTMKVRTKEALTRFSAEIESLYAPSSK